MREEEIEAEALDAMHRIVEALKTPPVSYPAMFTALMSAGAMMARRTGMRDKAEFLSVSAKLWDATEKRSLVA